MLTAVQVQALQRAYMQVERELGRTKILLNLAKAREKKLKQEVKLLRANGSGRWISGQEYMSRYGISRTTLYTFVKHGIVEGREVPITYGSKRTLTRFRNLPPGEPINAERFGAGQEGQSGSQDRRGPRRDTLRRAEHARDAQMPSPETAGQGSGESRQTGQTAGQTASRVA